MDFEGEIGLVIGEEAKHVQRGEAWSVVAGVAPVNDVTARDLQRTDSQWSRAKGFDTFCALGEMTPLAEVDRAELTVTTTVNGRERQRGSIGEMIFSPPVVIEYVTRFMTLEPGDLVATGTPAGVGPLRDGDIVEVSIGGAGSVTNGVRAV